MAINNVVPAIYIVSEPVINMHVAMAFSEKNNRLEPVIKQLGKKPTTPLDTAVIILDTLSGETSAIDNPYTNILSIKPQFLNHFNYTIILHNVSQRSINELYKANIATLHITELENPSDLNFWLPLEYQVDPDRAKVFGEAYMAFSELRDRLTSEYGINTFEGLRPLVPDSFAKTAIISVGLYDLLQMIMFFTNLSQPSELRVVFHELAAKMTVKSKILMGMFCLIDSNSRVYGLDTIKLRPEDWHKYAYSIK